MVDTTLVEAMQWAVNCCSEEHELLSWAIIEFEKLAEENNRLRAALREISQLTPGLWKSLDYHHINVTEKFNEARLIAFNTLVLPAS